MKNYILYIKLYLKIIVQRSYIWKKEELHSLLADWKAAYKAAATGKSYTIAGRSLTRQDLSEIRAQIDYLGRELCALETGVYMQTRKALVIR